MEVDAARREVERNHWRMCRHRDGAVDGYRWGKSSKRWELTSRNCGTHAPYQLTNFQDLPLISCCSSK
jgi:hypothetical protein